MRSESKLKKMKMPGMEDMHEHMDMEEGSPEEEAAESPDEEQAEQDQGEGDKGEQHKSDELAQYSDDDLMAEIKKRGLEKQLEDSDSDSGEPRDQKDMEYGM